MSAHQLDLRHALLRAVDRAVGAEAELAQCRKAAPPLDAVVAALRAEVAQSDERQRELTAERDRLAARIAAIYASQTWRLGQSLVRPAARLARQIQVASAGARGRRR